MLTRPFPPRGLSSTAAVHNRESIEANKWQGTHPTRLPDVALPRCPRFLREPRLGDVHGGARIERPTDLDNAGLRRCRQTS